MTKKKSSGPSRSKTAGAKAHDPNRLASFVRGHITLGELEGVSKKAQYQMAKVGHDLLLQGKRDQAQKVFEGLQALDPFDAYFHAVLGTIAYEKADGAQAEKLYSRALEINPFLLMALAGRGEVRMAAGRIESAIADLTKAVKEDPTGKEAATRRAQVLLGTIRSQLEVSKKDPARASREARLALEKQAAASGVTEVLPTELPSSPAPAPEVSKPKEEAKKVIGRSKPRPKPRKR